MIKAAGIIVDVYAEAQESLPSDELSAFADRLRSGELSPYAIRFPDKVQTSKDSFVTSAAIPIRMAQFAVGHEGETTECDFMIRGTDNTSVVCDMDLIQ